MGYVNFQEDTLLPKWPRMSRLWNSGCHFPWLCWTVKASCHVWCLLFFFCDIFEICSKVVPNHYADYGLERLRIAQLKLFHLFCYLDVNIFIYLSINVSTFQERFSSTMWIIYYMCLFLHLHTNLIYVYIHICACIHGHTRPFWTCLYIHLL